MKYKSLYWAQKTTFSEVNHFLAEVTFNNNSSTKTKVQNNLPYNGVFPGKITTKSCNLGAFIKASVTRRVAVSPLSAIL